MTLLMIGYVLFIFLLGVWCLQPRECQRCHAGHYHKDLMAFSPIFLSRCDNCGHYENQ
jgi:hypothetical protein